jgi:hypothetical protein
VLQSPLPKSCPEITQFFPIALTPAVMPARSSVILKLLAFTLGMIVIPIGSYFVTVDTVFNGARGFRPLLITYAGSGVFGLDPVTPFAMATSRVL